MLTGSTSTAKCLVKVKSKNIPKSDMMVLLVVRYMKIKHIAVVPVAMVEAPVDSVDTDSKDGLEDVLAPTLTGKDALIELVQELKC